MLNISSYQNFNLRFREDLDSMTLYVFGCDICVDIVERHNEYAEGGIYTEILQVFVPGTKRRRSTQSL